MHLLNAKGEMTAGLLLVKIEKRVGTWRMPASPVPASAKEGTPSPKGSPLLK